VRETFNNENLVYIHLEPKLHSIRIKFLVINTTVESELVKERERKKLENRRGKGLM
jgi:hypothetical protein